MLTRLLVEQACYDEVLNIAKAAAENQTVGNPAEWDHIGPLFDKIQFDRVQGMIQKGIDEGASFWLVARADQMGKMGWFVKPTIFAVSAMMAIAQWKSLALCL